MNYKYQEVLNECYKRVKVNPQDIKARQTLNILYLDHWMEHTPIFDTSRPQSKVEPCFFYIFTCVVSRSVL